MPRRTSGAATTPAGTRSQAGRPVVRYAEVRVQPPIVPPQEGRSLLDGSHRAASSGRCRGSAGRTAVVLGRVSRRVRPSHGVVVRCAGQTRFHDGGKTGRANGRRLVLLCHVSAQNEGKSAARYATAVGAVRQVLPLLQDTISPTSAHSTQQSNTSSRKIAESERQAVSRKPRSNNGELGRADGHGRRLTANG